MRFDPIDSSPELVIFVQLESNVYSIIQKQRLLQSVQYLYLIFVFFTTKYYQKNTQIDTDNELYRI